MSGLELCCQFAAVPDSVCLAHKLHNRTSDVHGAPISFWSCKQVFKAMEPVIVDLQSLSAVVPQMFVVFLNSVWRFDFVIYL